MAAFSRAWGGQLLTTVGIGANDYIYHIAWVIVGKENKDNWKWFLELQAIDLEINNNYNWAFMIDRQKVIQFLCLMNCCDLL